MSFLREGQDTSLASFGFGSTLQVNVIIGKLVLRTFSPECQLWLQEHSYKNESLYIRLFPYNVILRQTPHSTHWLVLPSFTVSETSGKDNFTSVIRRSNYHSHLDVRTRFLFRVKPFKKSYVNNLLNYTPVRNTVEKRYLKITKWLNFYYARIIYVKSSLPFLFRYQNISLGCTYSSTVNRSTSIQ